MKKILILVILLLCGLCGCNMKEDVKFKINEDKSLEMTFFAISDKEFLNGIMNEVNGTNKTYTEKQMLSYLEKNMASIDENFRNKMIEYNQDGYIGYKLTVEIDSIDNITSDDANFDIRDYIYVLKNKLFKKEENKYISQIYYSKMDIENYIDSNDKDKLEQAKSIDLDFVFEVTLPYKALSNNATLVSEDGKTLKWEIDSSKEGKIEFEFSFEEYEEMIDETPEEPEKLNNIKIYLIFSSVIVAVIAIFLGIIIKRRRKEDF